MKFHELFPEFYRDNERDWYQFIKEVFSPEFEIALKEIESLWNLIDIDTIPEDKLPLLADNLGFTLSDILPVSFRKQLANAIDLHKFKGTRFAVEKVLEVMGLPANLSEWFEYGGEPYKFKLFMKSIMSDPALWEKLVSLVNEYKNERSWLDGIGIHREHTQTVKIGSAIKNGKRYTIGLHFKISVSGTAFYSGSAFQIAKKTSIGVYVPQISTAPSTFYHGSAFRRARKIVIGVANNG